MNLPRSFTLIVHLDGSDAPTMAESYQPPVIRIPFVLGAVHNVLGGGMDSNCLMPHPPVISMAQMKVTFPDGSKGTFKPRIPDGRGGMLGILAAEKSAL